MYKIVGADGKEYGPITADVLRQWIAQGRANAQAKVQVEGTTEWKPLGIVPEFSNCFGPQMPPTIVTGTTVRKINGFATAGIIFGILSWVGFCCCDGIIFNVLGLIFSLIGLSQIKQHPDLYEGRGLAIAGLILSLVSLLLAVVLILVALAAGHFNWSVNGFDR